MSHFIYTFPIPLSHCAVGETIPQDHYGHRQESKPLDCSDEELARIRAVLRKLTVLRIRNAEDAEDLVQETLLTMTMKPPGSELRKGLLVWGMGILRKKVGNYYQKFGRKGEIRPRKASSWEMERTVAASASPESSLRHDELLALISRILSDFPPPERNVLDLHLSGLQAREIVARLYPERYQNVINRLHRGRKKLARELRKFGY